MREKRLLHKLFDVSSLKIDNRITRALFDAIEALVNGHQLSIFGLGRYLKCAAKVKHKIKCIDRLFGNKTLHGKLQVYYKRINAILLSGKKQPIILIDWSGLTKCGAFRMLRASIPVGGRALTLLDVTYPLEKYGKHKTHKEFLRLLKSCLPDGCKPIIVTDAGFRCTWFNLVISFDWTFIGRVRNNTQYKCVETNRWLPVKSLYETATQKATYIGEMLLAKSNPVLCHFYTLSKAKKNRVKKNLVGKKVQCSSSLKHAKREAEPWLLVTSLSTSDVNASQLVKIYSKRMQIEEAFRDIKNTRNGLCLRNCRSYSKGRLDVALLIGAISTLLLWVIGTATKNKHLHRNFQANSVKTKNVLSNFTIGIQAIIEQVKFKMKELLQALADVQLSTTALDIGFGIIDTPFYGNTQAHS